VDVPGRSADAAEAVYLGAAESLRRAVWDPVIPHLGKARMVFVVPDGPLHRVAFETLPARRGRYLVEKGPLIHYLAAERDLVGPPGLPSRGKGFLAMGAPAFDEGSLFAALAPSGQTAATLAAKAASLTPFRGERSTCGDFQSLTFPPLPHSRREVEEIARIWGAGSGSDAVAVSRTGVDANEAAFKAEASGKGTLHLATHGFFLEGRCPSSLRWAVESGSGVLEEGSLTLPMEVEDPLLLTGLAFAGANRRDAAQPDEEDGILTADEVAAMDLSGVDLAVLSACGTGLGEIRTGEGVLGLRRAFRVAGARTLITSLWAVDDEATRRWMREFYTAHRVRGMRTAESIRQANRAALRSARRETGSGHPFYWAGFVASGDWK
jgi:CHAT domain-containing protein